MRPHPHNDRDHLLELLMAPSFAPAETAQFIDLLVKEVDYGEAVGVRARHARRNAEARATRT
jgi:hypothetical protein